MVIFAAIENTISSEIYVDSAESPSVTLLKLPGKHYIAGDVSKRQCFAEITTLMSFWDYLIPDSNECCVRLLSTIPTDLYAHTKDGVVNNPQLKIGA